MSLDRELGKLHACAPRLFVLLGSKDDILGMRLAARKQW